MIRGGGYACERAMLRFMLTIRTREGLPVVCAETLLREFVEDLGTGEDLGSKPLRLCCHIEQAYRIMVGAVSLGYNPDWLCVPPSPRFGHPRFPAWDRSGRRMV